MFLALENYSYVGDTASFRRGRKHVTNSRSQNIKPSCDWIWITACVTRKWAGLDLAWGQYQPEARKKPVKRGESHLSGARCVGRECMGISDHQVQYFYPECILVTGSIYLSLSSWAKAASIPFLRQLLNKFHNSCVFLTDSELISCRTVKCSR